MDLPTQLKIASITVNLALVAAMFAFRRSRLGPIRGFLLGFDVWAVLIVAAWATAEAVGLPVVLLWRIDLVTPSAFGLLFVCMWSFWRRRFWFLKGLALFFGVSGTLALVAEHLDPIYGLLHLGTTAPTAFILTACLFTLVCGALTSRRTDEASTGSTPPT